MIEKFRDVLLLQLNEKERLTIACDSCGGIGRKEHDIVKVDPYVTGYYTACVVLAETIAIGAKPLSVINTLSVEMDYTGRRIIEGIIAALEDTGLEPDAMLTGSTEENIPVTVTSLGLTVIGTLASDWTYPKAKEGDVVVAIGIPKVGQEVVEDEGDIMDLSTLLTLRKMDFVKDLLPVGSKGIAYEVSEMGRTSGLTYTLVEESAIDLYKSAGPATCILAAIDESYLTDLNAMVYLPIHVVGQFMTT